jgi:hypothetical protein
MLSATSPTRQLVAGPSRLSRAHSQKKFTPGLAIDKISEVDGTDDGVYADPAPGSETDGGVEEKPHARSQIPPTRQRVNALTRSATRPRRSASLSDASSACPGRLGLKRSLTVMTGARASRRAASDERGLALWCAAWDKYGSDQLSCRSDARNVGGKDREFALEDGVSITLLLFSSCILNCVYVSRVRQSSSETWRGGFGP